MDAERYKSQSKPWGPQILNNLCLSITSYLCFLDTYLVMRVYSISDHSWNLHTSTTEMRFKQNRVLAEHSDYENNSPHNMQMGLHVLFEQLKAHILFKAWTLGCLPRHNRTQLINCVVRPPVYMVLSPTTSLLSRSLRMPRLGESILYNVRFLVAYMCSWRRSLFSWLSSCAWVEWAFCCFLLWLFCRNNSPIHCTIRFLTLPTGTWTMWGSW